MQGCSGGGKDLRGDPNARLARQQVHEARSSLGLDVGPLDDRVPVTIEEDSRPGRPVRRPDPRPLGDLFMPATLLQGFGGGYQDLR